MKATHTDCKRNVETETEIMERWRNRKILKLQICKHFFICIRYVDLRNTSKATFWSEPCRPDLHSKGKQHSNMWETESQNGCGRKERAYFHESLLNPMFHHRFFNMGGRSYLKRHRAGADLRGFLQHFDFFIQSFISQQRMQAG